MPVGSSTRIAKLNALTQLKAAGGVLDVATLILFANPLIPTTDTVIGDLVAPTFTGYAPVAALAFGTPFVDVAGQAVVVAPSEDFVRTGGAISDTIYGWALVDAGLTELYYAEAFDTPVPLGAVGDGLSVEPRFAYGA